jgi:hypothetical protein
MIPANHKVEIWSILVQDQLGQIVQFFYEVPSGKKLTPKRADGVIQVIESLPNKHESLSSNTSTVKEREREREVVKGRERRFIVWTETC